ncbi:MAG: Fe(2+)-trafficking protein [Planctomycetota bacterium]
MSRAYQLLGQTLLKLGRNDEAKGILTRGYTAAAERGDVMPQRAIASLLTEKLNAELPDVKPAEEVKAEVEADGQTVLDRRTGAAQPKLAFAPMRGPTGAFIQAHFGQQTWNQWIGQGTKVINELRLDFSNADHQDVYDQHMLEWLQVTQEEIDAFAAASSA